MKKEAGKIFALSILAILMVSFFVGVVSAFTADELNKKFIESEVYQFIKPYLVPVGMEGFWGLIIGVISLAILFSITIDVFTFIPVFNKTTSWMIAIGVGIVMIISGWVVTTAGWFFNVGAVLFGWAGSVSIFLTILIGIGILFAFFYGNYWLTTHLMRIRTARENLETEMKGRKAGGAIAGLKHMAEEAAKK